MNTIGVDLGTTYSTFAMYNVAKDNVEEFKQSEMEGVHIPSVVCYDKRLKKYTVGLKAREVIGNNPERYSPYQSFKMLLPENNQELLRSRGYDDQRDPRNITKTFLGHYLNTALSQGHLEQFDKMVVCVPEIWNGSGNTIDGRKKMRALCQELNVAKKIKIVTEPEAASAYFVYNYQKLNQSSFKGYILTVDYGGGTLDITLNKVYTDEVNGKPVTMLRSLTRAGRGENQQGTIGAAGVAYMEGVVAEAFRTAEIIRDNEKPVRDAEFLKAVIQVERCVQTEEADIKAIFASCNYDLNRIQQDYADEVLELLDYRGKEVPITVKHLAKAYQDIIYPVLDEAINSIIDNANSLGVEAVDLSRPRNDVLYALVGGFGKYSLVAHQVYDKLGLTSVGQILNSPVYNRSESAVALGAALIAEDIVNIQPIAAQSWGMWGIDMAGEYVLNYGIKYGQPIEKNKVYYIPSRSNPNQNLAFNFGGQNIEQFLIGYDYDFEAGYPMLLRKEYQLKNLPDGRVNIGFSEDEDEVITVYIQLVDMNNRPIKNGLKKIELTTYREMFVITESVTIRNGVVHQ